MRRHETPTDIANALARHGPRKLVRILDPAVGNGVLLRPFFRRSRIEFEAFAVDKDSRPLKRLRGKFSPESRDRLKIVHADFLKWACSYGKDQAETFDCVVMNPPFAGQRKKWRSLVGLKNLLGLDSIPEIGPVEAGFVLGAILLLKPGGRLLAVLPASILTTPSCDWIRGVLRATGAVQHVHELPRFAFPKVESRIYLAVYEKGRDQKETLLLNHDLNEPERMVVGSDVVTQANRLDFGYHSAFAAFRRLRQRASLGWRRIIDLATVRRGTEKTPGIGRAVIHTSNYTEGFWEAVVARRHAGPVCSGALKTRAGDILVRRVSRNCARSFGIGVNARGARVSDCVLVIRPKYGVSSAKMLFAIRCLMALDFGPGLLERGTGASYIGQNDLGALEIPYVIAGVYGELFAQYSQALKNRSFVKMQLVESEVVARLVKTPS